MCCHQIEFQKYGSQIVLLIIIPTRTSGISGNVQPTNLVSYELSTVDISASLLWKCPTDAETVALWVNSKKFESLWPPDPNSGPLVHPLTTRFTSQLIALRLQICRSFGLT